MKTWIKSVLSTSILLAGCAFGGMALGAEHRIPVILDADIGDDIDDTWAIVMLLKSPQLDVKLITTTYGKAEYRAKLFAKFLTVAKRTDIPVGLGAGGRSGTGGQESWVKDYDLKSYAGKVYEDGVQAMIDTIKGSAEPITLISIGPSNTVAAALERDPSITAKTTFVGMQGSVRVGYGAKDKPCAEWNLKANPAAAQKALLAPWKKTVITPLDTCGRVQVSGELFKSLCDSQDELVKTLIENYRIWSKKGSVSDLKGSSTLFDTVAIYLAFPEEKSLVKMEELTIGVTKEGFTTIDPAGVKMSVATEWTDLKGYRELLVKILLSTPGK